MFVETQCFFDTVSDLNIIDNDFEIRVDCNSSRGVFEIEDADLDVGLVELKLSIDDPCYVCDLTSFVNVSGEREGISISDNNLFILIFILLSVIFIIKLEKKD